ncbi:MAG: substrate-binding domain-containing protein [Acidimicrobiales bacterium]
MGNVGTVSRPDRRRVLVLGLIGALLLATFDQGGVSRASGTTARSVDVLYAGSLLDLMENQIGPAFHHATGDNVVGIANGSTALATEIKGGTEVADVFISASPSVNRVLEGPANGDWVSSYRILGRSPLVLGYNPASSFAAALRSSPWYDVVARPGFLLGRTDPAIDPKGVLAVTALREIARRYDRPRLASLAASTRDVFTEASLVGELDAGQLDAGFFYTVEAAAAHLHTVALVGTHLAATFTVAIVNRAPHARAANAFVAFLFGRQGRAILSRNGVTPVVSLRAGRVVSSPPTTKP